MPLLKIPALYTLVYVEVFAADLFPLQIVGPVLVLPRP